MSMGGCGKRLLPVPSKTAMCVPNTLGCTLQLSPVHEQLRGIDEMYVDEKFEINGTCPAGQAVCADLLSEAHELVESIQEQIPDEDDE